MKNYNDELVKDLQSDFHLHARHDDEQYSLAIKYRDRDLKEHSLELCFVTEQGLGHFLRLIQNQSKAVLECTRQMPGHPNEGMARPALPAPPPCHDPCCY